MWTEVSFQLGSANLRHQQDSCSQEVSLQGSHLLPAALCCPPWLSASFSQQPSLVIGPTHTALSPSSGLIFFPCPFQLKRAKWKSEVAQSCLTLWDPVDCSPPGSSVHGIPQARILEWVAISFSKGSSRPRDQTQVSRVEADALTSEPPGKPRVPSNTNPEKLHYPLWSSLSPTCTFVNCSFIQFSWILFKSVTQFECAITFLGKTLAQTVPFGVSYSYCFPSGTVVKNPLASAGHARDTCSNPLSGEDPLE